jgi:ankyrin repeat protein
MTCARAGATAAVKTLLARGAAVNATERWNGQTALMWAAAQGHADVARALIEARADVNARSAVRRVFVNTGGTTSGRSSSDMDFGGSTPLLFAARAGSVDTARVLLAAGARINERAADGSTALGIASLSAHTALAEFLLDQGAAPDDAGAGYAALHAAVLRSDIPLIKKLLGKGANPNVRIAKGMNMPRASQYYVFSTLVLGATPFFLAAKYAEPELMRVLASGGADTTIGLADGTTPLLAAAGSMWVFAGSEDRRERAFAPDVLAAQREDETPTFEAVKLAWELGGDVNAADKTGQTPMHAAATLDFIRVIELLASKGARIDAKNAKGLTPLALAQGATNDPRTAALLRTLGAKD